MRPRSCGAAGVEDDDDDYAAAAAANPPASASHILSFSASHWVLVQA